MKITINGEKTIIEPNTNILILLNQRGIVQKKGVAIACNDDVIPQTRWEEHILQEGDVIEILRATAGG